MERLIQGFKCLASRAVSPQAGGVTARHLGLIIVVAWFANFLHFPSFGLYEDDWYNFAAAGADTFKGWFTEMFRIMATFFQGRPMQVFDEMVVAFLGAHFRSIAVPYLVVFFFFSLSVVLFYRVLQVRFPSRFCRLATLLYVLSPLTTIKQNLVCGAMLGPAFTLLFAAILLRRKYPSAAYLSSILALLTYESIFLLFLASPLLEKGKFTRRKLRSMGVHLAICAVILACYLAIRHQFGESRIVSATGVGAAELLKRVAVFDAVFLWKSFQLYWYAASTGWKECSLEAAVYLLGFFIWVVYLLLNASPRHGSNGRNIFRIRWIRCVWVFRNGALLGFVLLVLGYLTAYFQSDANSAASFPIAGRDTRFSASAAVGSSMMAAAILVIFLDLFRGRWTYNVAKACVIACLSPVFVYCFVVQYDYVRAWEYQRSFFSQLVLLSPDLQRDTFFVVRWRSKTQPGFGPVGRPPSIGALRYGMQVALLSLGGWGSSPRIYFVQTGQWKDYLVLQRDGKLHWTASDIPGGGIMTIPGPITPGRILLVQEDDDGRLTRLDNEDLVIGGVPVLQKVAPGGKPGTEWHRLNGSGLLENVVYGAAREAVRRPESD